MKKKLPNPKRMEPAFYGEVDGEKGWWFKTPTMMD